MGVRARTSKPGRGSHLVAMAHPYLLEPCYPAKKTALCLEDLQRCEPIFALVALPNVAAQKVRHQLLAVADSQNGRAQ